MTQYDIDEERWRDIFDFPGYKISDWGKVMSEKTNSLITPTKKATGYYMVGLMKSGIQTKRSLPLLVSNAFLSRPPEEAFNTPIHLDGNRANCHWRNLMWRPRWFSLQYMRQFDDGHLTYGMPIADMETGERFPTSMDAAMTHGLLDSEILLSMHHRTYVWPTRQTFYKL